MKIKKIVLTSVLFCITAISLLNAADDNILLENENLKIQFNDKGLSKIYDKMLDKEIEFTDDNFSVTINDLTSESNKQKAKIQKSDSRQTVSFEYETEQFIIKIIYELKPGWRFISKQLTILSKNNADYTVKTIKLFDGSIGNKIHQTYRLTGGRYGISLRMKKNPEDAKPAYGCFLLIQNPFTKYDTPASPSLGGEDYNIKITYNPEMKWKSEYGPFLSDRSCIGTYTLSGNTFRADSASEWQYIQDPDKFLNEGEQIDQAEIEAVTECARAFLLEDRNKSIKVHIGWCENDYQIDTATEAGRTEYKRILDQAADFGCNYVLFTPHNSALAPLSENTDAWGWESLLWLNIGQKIRKDQWTPGSSPIPDVIKEMLDYAKSKNLKLMAYVYPSLPFMQNPEWTQWMTSNGRTPGGYETVDTGLRSYQDWFVDKLAAFQKAAGCGGYSFDHWWIGYRNPDNDPNVRVSSQYQQWFGCRRILENLRKKMPDLIIDGRQQYHHFGTWTWLAGSYPHPTMNDEQPGSFNPITDLSTDRVFGARQRYVAWRLMTRDFCPIEILPGFITHQTQRSDANMVMRRDQYRTRDWDCLGWKYSLISSIATAPFNHVVNYLPARDIEEYKSFPDEDKKFFRDWLNFTDINAKYMKNIRPIIGQPMVGRCDGTSAIIEDNGFLFIFNPNYRKMDAQFKLDSSIGLIAGEKFIIKALYPEEGKLIGCPEKGFFGFGDNVSIRMDGTSAVVLKIESLKELPTQPTLLNSAGNAPMYIGDTLTLTEITGQIGDEKDLTVVLPQEKTVKNVTVNANMLPFEQKGKIIKCKVKFAGQYFSQAQAVGTYNPQFSGQVVEEKFTIPKRIFDQLAERKKKWPVTYTKDDLVAPWTDPSRLLLFVQIAEPFFQKEVTERRRGRETAVKRSVPIRKDEVKIEIDGKEIETQEAYNGVYPYVSHTCLGIYADVSDLRPDVEHTVKVTLPEGLKPGQFQGLFFEHVETEFTSQIVN